MDNVNVTSVPTDPEVGVSTRLKPSTVKEACPTSPFGLPVTVMVNVPGAAYFATVKVAVAPVIEQVGLLTDVPEIVQLVSVGSNPASVTVMSVPGIA